MTGGNERGLRDVSLLVLADGTGGPTTSDLETALAPLGHCVVRVETVAEAVRLVNATRFAVIVVATRLPGRGAEIARRLQAHDSAHRTPILLTADGGEGGTADSQADIEYLERPIDGERMRRRVQLLVSLYRRSEEVARLASALAEETRSSAAARAAAAAATSASRRAELLIRRKDKLIGILGHDLRNPLSAVLLGSRRLMTAADLSSSTKAVATSIHHAAERMSILVDDILDFARASSKGTFPIQPRLTNLQEVATAIVEETRQANPGKRINLTAKGDLLIECDADRIAQALGNLVTNAVQHGDGPVAVSVEAGDGAVRIRVHNRGAAIPRHVRSAIFDPFKHRDLGSRGLGLGLHIVDTIVRAHGGAVVVRSSKSRGTTFEASWPRRHEPHILDQPPMHSP